MARVRCITEMGMGVDVHGRDATKAARRAVSDAIRHSSLGFFRMVGKTSKDMFVDVTIAVPDPGAVDTSAVAKELPYGTVTVTAVKGGLDIPAEQGSDSIIIANAAVIVSSTTVHRDKIRQGSVMPVTIYGIKNCDTMKKARAWLDGHGVAYGFHDYKTEGIARDRLKDWCDEVGWETLLNRAGTTFRKLPDQTGRGSMSARRSP